MGFRIRQSNFELLRIISMLMILMVHFTGATFPLPDRMQLTDFGNINTTAKMLMESFSIIGVNCFVLISGFFGIKPSVKGFTNFIFCCLFYSVVIYGIFAIADPSQYGWKDVLQSFAIFSHTDLWFIPTYLTLYVFSPLINKGFNALHRHQHITLLCALTFINVYLGWFWGGKVNPTGYNAMHLIYIYVIGRFIHTYHASCSLRSWHYFIGFIVAFLLIFASTFVLNSSMAFAYNSPAVIISSIFFFLIFTQISFYDVYINHIASSAFAIYLIHQMPPVWLMLKNFLVDITRSADYFTFSFFWVIYVAAIFSACIFIDKLRIQFTDPLLHKLFHKKENYSI